MRKLPCNIESNEDNNNKAVINNNRTPTLSSNKLIRTQLEGLAEIFLCSLITYSLLNRDNMPQVCSTWNAVDSLESSAAVRLRVITVAAKCPNIKIFGKRNTARIRKLVAGENPKSGGRCCLQIKVFAKTSYNQTASENRRNLHKISDHIFYK